MEEQNGTVPSYNKNDPSGKREHENRKNHLIPALVTLIVFLAVATGALTFLLLDKDSGSNIDSSSSTTTQPADTQESTESSEDENKLKEYNNENYGFSFMYPADWGDVETSSLEGESGGAIVGNFSNRSAVEFSATTTDYQPFGRDGACSVASFATIRSTATLDDYRRDAGESSFVDESDQKGQEYKTLIATIEDTDSIYIYESFEAGTTTGLGSCLGYFAAGHIISSELEITSGISFSLTTPLNYASALSVSTLDQYKEDKEFFVDQELRDGFVTTIKSIKPL